MDIQSDMSDKVPVPSSFCSTTIWRCILRKLRSEASYGFQKPQRYLPKKLFGTTLSVKTLPHRILEMTHMKTFSRILWCVAVILLYALSSGPVWCVIRHMSQSIDKM